MTAQESLMQKLEELLKTGEFPQGITAGELAELLPLKRSVLSLYLNQLSQEGKLVKSNTRPVRFTLAARPVSVDAFRKFIGYSGSHLNQITQCKSAVMYPPHGLPIMITGNSGSGKSYLASLIYQYAVEQQVIGGNAPFIELNCADYANNPELLSSMLFGHVEGAFTGAGKGKKGLLDESDGGFLFLDETHRLSFENQEKLFLFMDKGRFRRLGETDQWHTSQVRFIFATTEKMEESFVATFQRRIPIQIKLLDYHDRPLVEKLDLIEYLFKQEARQLNKSILIHEEVINYLIELKAKGNIGVLKNTIKISIANAYNGQRHSRQLFITTEHLPLELLQKEIGQKIHYQNQIFEVAPDPDFAHSISFALHDEFKEKLYQMTNYNEFFDESPRQIVHQVVEEIERQMESFRFDPEMGNKAFYRLNEQQIVFDLEETNKRLKSLYGTTLKKSVVERLTKVCLYVLCYDEQLTFSHGLLQSLHHNNNLQYRIAKKIQQGLSNASQIHQPTLFALIYDILDLEGLPANRIEGIIVAHGASTATSIAAVANSLCKDYIFEPFDMPIDVDNSEIVEKISEYLYHMNTEKGVLILVDMGSLQELYEPIKNHLQGELLIVTNLSTLMAIATGLKIKTDTPFAQIIEGVQGAYVSEVKFYEGIARGNNVVISCISGIGIAKKIKGIFDQKLKQGELDIVTMEYRELKRLLQGEAKRQLKKTKLIITTNSLLTDPIPSVNIENILNAQEADILKDALMDVVEAPVLEQILEELIKLFSMEGIKNHLSFLNPDVILNEVHEVIKKYESFFQTHFENYIRLNLLVHISVMVERLIVHDPKEIDESYGINREQAQFIEVSRRIFKPVEEKYKFQIPESELLLIYEIVEQNLILQ